MIICFRRSISNKLFYILSFKKKKEKGLAQNGVGSIPTDIPISCFKTMLRKVKKNLFTRKHKAFLPAPLQVRYIDTSKKSIHFLTLV